jgi:hypothetical protein
MIAASTASATPLSGTAHHRWRFAGGRTALPATASGGGSIVWSCVSVTLALSVDGLTAQAAWIAGLAVVALVLTGWRKPARARPRSPRGGPAGVWRSDRAGVEVEHLPTPTYRRPGPIRRLLAAIAGAGLTVVSGAILATVVAFTVAFAVITLTDLLRR